MLSGIFFFCLFIFYCSSCQVIYILSQVGIILIFYMNRLGQVKKYHSSRSQYQSQDSNSRLFDFKHLFLAPQSSPPSWCLQNSFLLKLIQSPEPTTAWKLVTFVHVFQRLRGLCITHVQISCPVKRGEACKMHRVPDYQISPRIILHLPSFPDGSDGKESACNARDPGLITGLGRSSGEGNGYPFQYSCLENAMDRIPGGLQFMGSQ